MYAQRTDCVVHSLAVSFTCSLFNYKMFLGAGLNIVDCCCCFFLKFVLCVRTCVRFEMNILKMA